MGYIKGTDDNTGQMKQALPTDVIIGAIEDIKEYGGTFLGVGAIADGEVLKRNGSAIVGAAPSGGVWSKVASGALSVDNDVETTLHTLTPAADKVYRMYIRLATAPSSSIQWGYYETNYAAGAGAGRDTQDFLSSGDIDFNVRFDGGGMAGALTVDWIVYESSDN
jgi:hypothetical protein